MEGPLGRRSRHITNAITVKQDPVEDGFGLVLSLGWEILHHLEPAVANVRQDAPALAVSLHEFGELILDDPHRIGPATLRRVRVVGLADLLGRVFRTP